MASTCDKLPQSGHVGGVRLDKIWRFKMGGNNNESAAGWLAGWPGPVHRDELYFKMLVS